MADSRIRTEIGIRIAALREGRGMSQSLFAQLIGMHPSQLNRIEKGEQNATIDTYIKIVDALGTSFADFFSTEAFHAPENAQAVVPAIARDDVEEAVLAGLASNPVATIPQLANHISRSVSTVDRAMRRLRDAGRIRRVGNNRSGHWEVIGESEAGSSPAA